MFWQGHYPWHKQKRQPQKFLIMNPIYLIPVGFTVSMLLLGLTIFGLPGGKRRRRLESMNRNTILGVEIQRSIQTTGNLEALMKFSLIVHEAKINGFEISDIGFANEHHLAKDCAAAYERGILLIRPNDREYAKKGDMISALERFRKEHKIEKFVLEADPAPVFDW